MAYLFPRNTVGFSTIESLLINSLEIQTQSSGGFKIYSNDPTTPLFTVDGITGTITTSGTLKVLGTAEFKETNISKTTQSLLELADNNATDTYDIGLMGQYNAGAGDVYTAAYRSGTDPARRWFFVNNVMATPPIFNLPGITTANFTGIVCNTTATNNGTVGAPAYAFYGDSDTGLYLITTNSLGITAGGVLGASITNTGAAIDIKFAVSATLYYGAQATLNDRVSVAGGGITTGSLTLQSSGLADKWVRYMSTNPAAAYSGTAFSYGAASHYFITNSAANYLISYTTENVTNADAPDYRHGSKVNLLTLNTSSISTTVPYKSAYNTNNAATPTYTFSTAPTTGIYQATANSLSFSATGTMVMDLYSTYITATQQIRAITGVLGTPAYSFTGATTTGLYRDAGLGIENVSFALGGVLAGKIVLNAGNNPQIQMGLGNLTYPPYAFGTTGAGIFSPQVGGATQGLVAIVSNGENVWTFKNRLGVTAMGAGNHQCLNTLDFIPNTTVLTARFDPTSSKIKTLCAQTASINGYNLIDSSVLLFYRFNNFAALGTDSSESTTKINATVIGPPATQTIVTDGTIVKKYVVDFASNNTPTAMYLSLTAYIANFAAIDTFTCAFWFKCTSAVSGDSTIVNFLNTTNGKNISINVLNGSDAIQVNVDSNAITALQFNTTGVAIKNGLWHHLVLLLGTGGNSLFIDGVELAYGVTLNYTSNGNGVPTADYSTNTLKDLTFNRITIGGKFDGVSFTNQYVGQLYSVYMSGAKLSDPQVAALYAEGSITTYSLDLTSLNVANIITTAQTIATDGTVGAPAYSFTSETSSGLYRIGAGNLGISILGANILSLNSTRLQNAGVYYSASGTIGAPAYSFTGDTVTGLYRIGANNLGISCGGVKQVDISTTKVAFTNQIILPNGSLANCAIQFAATAATGLIRDNSDNLILVSGGANVLQIGTSITSNTNFSMVASTQIYAANGTVGAPAYSFGSDTQSGWYRIGAANIGLALAGSLALDVNATRLKNFGYYYSADGAAATPAYTFTSDAKTGMYIIGGGNLGIAISGVNALDLNATRLQNAGIYYSANGSAASPAYTFTSDNQTGIYRSAANTIGISCANSLKLSIGPSLVTLTIPISIPDGSVASPSLQFTSSSQTGFYYGGTNSIGISAANTAVGTISSSAVTLNYPLVEAVGTANSPSYTFTGATTTGLYYSAANTALAVANVSNNTWLFSQLGSAHISLNPLTVRADGTNTAVAITSKKLIATSTQTLLNSIPVVEYNFTVTGALATDNSINKYTGATSGTVNSAVLTADSAGNGPLNSYGISLAAGAVNGIYTNVNMSEMSTATTLNITIMINFSNIAAGNCWIIYGNVNTPNTNYMRLYISAGVLNIVCVANSVTIIQATYSSLSINLWYRIEFLTTSTGNAMYINGSAVALSYAGGVGASNTQFPFNGMSDKSAIRTYVGGAVPNSYNSPACQIAYFAIIQTGTADTVAATYCEQVHELAVNKLIVSGYPYNSANTSALLNEGYYAVSSKAGQLQWDNSIQATPTSVTVSSSKDLVVPSLKMAGMMRYNFQVSAAATLNLTADRTGHYYSLTANTVTVTLPTGASQSGREFVFIWKGTPGSITINRSGSDTIGSDGTTSFVYSASTNTTFRLVYDGVSDWIFM